MVKHRLVDDAERLMLGHGLRFFYRAEKKTDKGGSSPPSPLLIHA